MQLRQLIGIVCLVGLATASPTPALQVGREADSERRLVVFAEDQFQGLSHEIEALNRCVKPEAPMIKRDEYNGLSASAGPGDAVVCEKTLENGRCETLSANNKCVPVPAGLAHNIRSVHQTTGSICRYYESTCATKTPVLNVDSHRHPLELSIDKSVGDRIGHVMCRIVTRPKTRDSDLVSLMPRVDDGTTLSPGVVRACKYSRETCSTVQALNSCQAFDDNLALQIDTLVQSGGSTCQYWTHKDCSRLILTSISGPKDYSPNLGPGNRDGKEISAVSCKNSRIVEVGKRTLPSSPSGPRAGQVLVADQTNLSGKTQLIDTATDDNNCSPLKNQFFWHLYSLYQYQGSVCTYWQYNCDTLSKDNAPVFTIDSRARDYYFSTMPYRFGDSRHKIAYIRCLNAAAADAYITAQTPSDPTILTASTTPPSSISARNITAGVAAEYSPLVVCHDVNLGGKCFVYTGPNCAPNPFNVDAIESLRLDKGYRCAFYPYHDCQATRGPPHYVDSKEGQVVINDVDYEIWSISCAPSPF